jgi:ribose/xylose/arabinose/galactoside ABC-type transport system permease subunit
MLIQEIVTASGFLRLGTAWQQWVPGVIVLVAAAISSRSRAVRRTRVAPTATTPATPATGRAAA